MMKATKKTKVAIPDHILALRQEVATKNRQLNELRQQWWKKRKPVGHAAHDQQEAGGKELEEAPGDEEGYVAGSVLGIGVVAGSLGAWRGRGQQGPRGNASSRWFKGMP